MIVPWLAGDGGPGLPADQALWLIAWDLPSAAAGLSIEKPWKTARKPISFEKD
jgi:hypothetical protein